MFAGSSNGSVVPLAGRTQLLLINWSAALNPEESAYREGILSWPIDVLPSLFQ